MYDCIYNRENGPKWVDYYRLEVLLLIRVSMKMHFFIFPKSIIILKNRQISFPQKMLRIFLFFFRKKSSEHSQRFFSRENGHLFAKINIFTPLRRPLISLCKEKHKFCTDAISESDLLILVPVPLVITLFLYLSIFCHIS